MPNLPPVPLRFLPRLILMAVVIGTIPVLLWANMALAGEVPRSRSAYEAQVVQLRQVTGNLEAAEHRLNRLTSSVSAVEEEVRASLRLIRPGERLILLEHETPRRNSGY